MSRKVGNAVVRNRIKRWVREYVRTHPSALPGCDVVVVARQAVAAATHGGVVRDLDALFRRARRPEGAA